MKNIKGRDTMIDIKDHFEHFVLNMMKPAMERFRRTDEEYQEHFNFLEISKSTVEEILDNSKRAN